MRQSFALLILLLLCGDAHGAGSDTVRNPGTGDCWAIFHRLGTGERLAMLGRRYKLPAGTLERKYPGLANTGGKGEIVEVPLGAYNRLSEMPWSLDTARPLYYKVQAGEKLADISRCAKMSRTDLMLVNGLSGEPAAGRYLCVGWVRYDARLLASSDQEAWEAAGMGRRRVAGQRNDNTADSAFMAGAGGRRSQAPYPPGVRGDQSPVPAVPAPPDTMVTVPQPAPQTMGDIWNEQTGNGQNVTSEKGSVAFYALNSRAPGAAAYAFHNTAPRGGIIRVRNLNNGRSIYVKVLGPLPETRQYAGAVLGLTMTAKKALGVQEERAFCELSYAGY